MRREELVFNVAKIRENNGLKFEAFCPWEPFKGSMEKDCSAKDIRVEADFSLGSDSVLVEAKISAKLVLICSRCAEPFEKNFEENFDETYDYSVQSIDLGCLIYDILALSGGIKPLCAENCAGRCPVCGKNLNAGGCDCEIKSESPFAPLKDLIKER